MALACVPPDGRCYDCREFDAREINLIFDAKHSGHVCPRCKRVYSPILPLRHFHYIDKASMKTRVRNDQRRAKMSVSTAALAKKILTRD